VEYDPVFETDRLASAMLDFETGTSMFTCSTQMVPFQRMLIMGTTGSIEIEIPFNAPPDKQTRLWIYSQAGKEEIVFDAVDQYKLQGEFFSQSILDNRPVSTSIEDAVNNMKVIEAVFASARTNEWVHL
jgi:predicted dehydrogenase